MTPQCPADTCRKFIKHTEGGHRGATPRFWTPTTAPINRWPEAPWGGGFWEGRWGGGVREGWLVGLGGSMCPWSIGRLGRPWTPEGDTFGN